MSEEIIKLLEFHNVIVNKEIAITHADKIVPIAHKFIKDITDIISPDEYAGAINEFIEMVIATQTYVGASLLVALYDMFPDIKLKPLIKNYKISLDASVDLQMRNHCA